MVFSNSNKYPKDYDSLICKFTLSFKTSTLTKNSHYTPYQQKLFEEVKRLKEIEGLGYRKISYILYDKGYRSVRTTSILTNNFIYSIYKKGKVREKRINRDFKTVCEYAGFDHEYIRMKTKNYFRKEKNGRLHIYI